MSLEVYGWKEIPASETHVHALQNLFAIDPKNLLSSPLQTLQNLTGQDLQNYSAEYIGKYSAFVLHAMAELYKSWLLFTAESPDPNAPINRERFNSTCRIIVQDQGVTKQFSLQEYLYIALKPVWLAHLPPVYGDSKLISEFLDLSVEEVVQFCVIAGQGADGDNTGILNIIQNIDHNDLYFNSDILLKLCRQNDALANVLGMITRNLLVAQSLVRAG